LKNSKRKQVGKTENLISNFRRIKFGEEVEAQKIDQKEKKNLACWSLIHPNARVLRDAFDVLGDLLEDEINIRVSVEGLRVKEMDPSHVCLAELEIPKKDLSDFAVVEEGPVMVSTKRLNGALGRCRGSERVEFATEGGKLKVGFPDSQRVFWIPVLEGREPEIPDPKLEFRAQMTIDPAELLACLKDIEDSGWETVQLAAEGRAAVLSAVNDGAEYAKRFEEGAVAEGRAVAYYNLGYLRSITTPKLGPVVLRWSDDTPLSATYTVGSGWLRFLLAPKVVGKEEGWDPSPFFSPGGGEG